MISILKFFTTNNYPTYYVFGYIIAFLLAIIMASTIHEYMHARVAYGFGDDTAKLMGRLTINPLAHIDGLGLLFLVLVGYGWAKPVPVNPLRYKKYRKGMFWVSISGVLANITIAFIFSGIYNLLFNKLNIMWSSNFFTIFLLYFILMTISVNTCLFLFNLLPIPPLDGFNILTSFTSIDNKFVNIMRKNGSNILFAYIIISNFLNLDIISRLSEIICSLFDKIWIFIFNI